MYWPEFQFDFRLELPRLMPHIAAVEFYLQAATTRILPPQWRETRETDSGRAAAARAWVNQRFAPGAPPVSLDDLCAMHRVVGDPANPECNPGLLRVLPVQVGRREVGGLHFGAPPESLPALMQAFIQFINSDRLQMLHPLIQALVAHFFLVTVHPFGDANGRVSRLLAAGMLRQRGYNVHGGFYALSAYFYANDVEYHTLLHRCWLHPLPFELTQFVAFAMHGFIMELRSIDSFLKMKLKRVVTGTTEEPNDFPARRSTSSQSHAMKTTSCDRHLLPL